MLDFVLPPAMCYNTDEASVPDSSHVCPSQGGAADRRCGHPACNRAGRITFGTFLFLFLTAGAVYLTLHYAPPWMAYRAMLEVIQEQVGAAAVASDDEISDRIMATAKEWGVPITKDQIEITRTDTGMSISTQWNVTINLFGGRYQQVLHFAPSTERPAASR
jgi:hypothetical protein